MKKNAIFIIGVVGVIVFGIIFMHVFDGDEMPAPTADLKTALEAEFVGAYPAEVATTGKIVELAMVAAPSEIEILAGQKTKVWSYNGTVPGPEIRLQLGDRLKINFTNNLPQETTIHFHGIRVPNAMDGVPGVTQDPIPVGGTFVYEFTPKDAGTFWFHPHVRAAEQMERGLFGTIIVEEPTTPYSQDEVWVLDDWRLTQKAQVDPRFVTPMDLMHDGRWGNVVTVNGSTQEQLKVRPGERIRLRLVNTSNARVYKLDFGRLDAQAIAVDGMNVKQVFSARNFELAPGNRLDVSIEIPFDAGGMLFPINDLFPRNIYTMAEIMVLGEAVDTPAFTPTLNDKIPDWEAALDYPVDKEYRLNARRNEKREIEWTINEKVFPDYDPFTLKYEEFNKLSFVNESSRIHPMHLHGQFFKVLSRDGVPANEPYFRDTVLVKPKERVEIGTVPLDKGKWLNHCHILEHAEAGMITITTVE